ncbi:GerAB/ArcD/ProY family transporter [Rossellomorea oryzaecorticis]|uniref:GerAB/ArcD/ProY family transporter n=1 Tax=Rossellomorea oryzaecorticis TaxID=1396505 RepID=A0ABU9K8D5_9BACI
MKVSIYPEQHHLVNAFLVMFIIHSAQLGVGVQGFQRIIYMEAKHDAWMSVLLSGGIASIIGFIMVKTLQSYESADLYGIQRDVYGKWIGTFLNLVYVSYCLGAFLVIIRNYIEVLQAWVFPEVPTWFLALTLMLLVLYGALGGFRIIVGVSFFSVFLALWLLGLLSYPLQYINWQNIMPMFEANTMDILKGTYAMTFTVIGFELMYSYYPYIKEKQKTTRYMQIGLAYTTFLYLAVMLVSLGYFSGGQLERTIWATLSLFKIVRLPFIERFEYVAITFWMLIILPNLMLYIWSASRGVTRIFQWKEKTFIWIFSIFLFAAIQFFVTREQINALSDLFGKVSFYVVYCYPIVLYIFVLIKKKVVRKGNAT